MAISTTIGFPHGGHATAVKVAESAQAIDEGARELDMVVNVGKVLSRDWPFVAEDIRAVVQAAHRRQALVKVIFENCFLADDHKERLCRICTEVGADFVKTSTGYGSGERRRRGPAPHAPLLAAIRGRQGGRWRADFRPPPGSAGAGRCPGRRQRDQGYSGPLLLPPGQLSQLLHSQERWLCNYNRLIGEGSFLWLCVAVLIIGFDGGVRFCSRRRLGTDDCRAEPHGKARLRRIVRGHCGPHLRRRSIST